MPKTPVVDPVVEPDTVDEDATNSLMNIH